MYPALVAPLFFSYTPTPLVTTISQLGLSANLVMCLDSGDSNSYPGSGQIWKDVSGANCSFYLGGNSSVETNFDPSFHGTGGGLSSNDYFYFTKSGNQFDLQSLTNPTWAQQATNANSKITLCEWFYLDNFTGAANQFFGSLNCGAGTNGWFIGNRANSTAAWANMEFVCINGGGLAWRVTPAANAINNSWNFFGVSVNFTSNTVNTIITQFNGSVEVATNIHANTPDPPTHTLQIGTVFTSPDATGERWSMAAAWNKALSQSELSSIYTSTKGRFGL